MEDWGPALTDEDLRQMGLLQSDAHEVLDACPLAAQ